MDQLSGLLQLGAMRGPRCCNQCMPGDIHHGRWVQVAKRPKQTREVKENS
jgi:hypothetical protein